MVLISIVAQFMAKHREEITFTAGVPGQVWWLAVMNATAVTMLSNTMMKKPHERDQVKF